MNRRQFLRLGALTWAAALCPGIAPRAALASPLRGKLRFRVKPFVLDEATIFQLQTWMGCGKYSAVTLTKRYLVRIEEIDRLGPALNAVIETNPDAVAIAADLDRERKSIGPRGPLHGIPVLIKDNIDTHDRMTTTAGSVALQGSIPPRDSFVAEKLRAAGAVILGKTNLSEWANFRGSL